MSKFELSLSKDYVPSWTVVDAVRELFQNALDQQTTVENNPMFFNYDPHTHTLQIGNKQSVLSTATLLLGSSTKRDDPNTIGKFGEGYKIATLVLTRSMKKVTFYNYGAREVWSPRFVKSKRYNGEEILTFFVDKKYPWTHVPDNNLTISIEGVTEEEYEQIIDSNLHLQELGQTITSKYGRILEDEKFKAKVFVNGLFVCKFNEYEQGYDFKPEYIEIDRDRKLADSFALKRLSSLMLSGVDSDKTVDLIKRGAADVAYMSYVYDNYSTVKSIANNTYESFKNEHGNNAIPVTTQDEYSKINSMGKYKPVIVSEVCKDTIKKSEDYIEPAFEFNSSKPVRTRLEEWLIQHQQSLSKKAIHQLKDIIDDIVE